MTPTASRLNAKLAERRRWFSNQWFFKWHHIGGTKPIEIDMFDGSHASYAGIAFWGSPRDVYWDAVTRGVRLEITKQFAWVDQEVRNYNRETAMKAIDESAGQLVSFTQAIRRAAVEKDRILRGDGINFPPENDAGYWDGTFDEDIQSQSEALKTSLPAYEERPTTQIAPLTYSWAWWDRNKIWLEPLGWAIGLIGTASGLIAFFM